MKSIYMTMSILKNKTKRQEKLSKLEEKYKGKAKIVFHTLSNTKIYYIFNYIGEEGNQQLLQLKKDWLYTIIGWSMVGNVGGIGREIYHTVFEL